MASHWGKGSKGKATQLHSTLVRARADGACEKCGRTDRALECAHMMSRRYANTRTDEHGAWALCNFCHRRLTEHPHEHVAFAIQTLGQEGWEALIAKAYSGTKVNWDAELARLKALALELGL